MLTVVAAAAIAGAARLAIQRMSREEYSIIELHIRVAITENVLTTLASNLVAGALSSLSVHEDGVVAGSTLTLDEATP